ncbi:MAG: polysaccharide biosynthesis tyrosine autokinase, partial [Clostridia bacterium]|nr:polysaccharide biosynthesis tyrosine autokinase [Clostridia bacterium]
MREDLIFAIDVTTKAHSPEMARDLAKCISANFNTIWRKIVSVDSENSALANFYLSELEKPSEAYQYEPSITSNAIFSALVGMVLVYVAFFLYAFFRRVLINEEELADAVGAPVLAAIPLIRGDRARKNRENQAPRIASGKLISDEQCSFAAAEAYRHLRTNLIYSRRIEGTPIYGVISAIPHDGKSLTSANLAVSFAQIGKKTAIVDCDLRCGTQNKIFGYAEDSEGLTEYLAGLNETPALRESEVENLYVLTAGNLSPDPTGLLHSARFDTLITYLSENFDCVIFDMPPIRIVSDALILADRISGYILVSRSGVSYERDVREAAADLKAIGADLFGAVLNGLNLKAGKNRRGSRSSYYYNYSDSASYTKAGYAKSHKAANDKKEADEKTSTNQKEA